MASRILSDDDFFGGPLEQSTRPAARPAPRPAPAALLSDDDFFGAEPVSAGPARTAPAMPAPQMRGLGPMPTEPDPAAPPPLMSASAAEPAPAPAQPEVPQSLTPTVDKLLRGDRSRRRAARATRQDTGPGSRYRAPDAQQAVVSPEEAQPNPFQPETFGELAGQRGRQVVEGATDVLASVPEGMAITGTRMEAGVRGNVPEVVEWTRKQIAQIDEILAGPDVIDRQREMLTERRAALEARLAGQEAFQLRLADDPMVPAQERDLFAMGDRLREAQIAVIGPAKDDTSFWGKLAQGGGSMLGFVGATIAGGAVGGPVGATLTGAGAGSALNQSAIYKEALEEGASEDEALAASAWAAVVGASEVVPIMSALKVLPPRVRGNVTNRVAKYLSNIALNAGEEAAQEAAVSVANNIIASEFYDEDRGTWDDVGESALIGAILGGGLAGAASAPNLARGPREEEPPSIVSMPDAPPQGRTPPPSLSSPADPERMDSPRLSQEDRESPIRNDMIDDGKAIVDGLLNGEVPPSEAQTTEPQSTPADEPGFAVMDEVETVDGESVPTGRKVRVNLTTGEAQPFVEDPAQAAPQEAAPAQAADPELTQAEGGEDARGPEVTPQKKPFTHRMKGFGIAPNSPVAVELRAAGITAQNTPGLFRADGLQDVDNLPASDWDDLAFAVGVDDASGYLDRQGVINALVQEFGGTPVQDAEQMRIQQEYDAAMANPPEEDFGALDALEIEEPYFPPPSDYDAILDEDGSSRRERAGNAVAEAFNAMDIPQGALTNAETAELINRLENEGGSVETLIWGIVERDVYGSENQSSAADADGQSQPAENQSQSGTEVRERDAGAQGDPGARPDADRSPAEGTAEGGRVDVTPEGEQTVIPGAERISAREQAERAQEQALRGGDDPTPEGGLFDEGARAQMDLLDAPASGPDQGPAAQPEPDATAPADPFEGQGQRQDLSAVDPASTSQSQPDEDQTAAVEQAAAETDPNPSDAQKEAGNYRKGSVRVQGLDLTIENAKGSTRSGTGPDGTAWSVRMPAHYGYIKRTEGADGDHLDVYIGDDLTSDRVTVIDQTNVEDGSFDEHKAMLGFASEADALSAHSAGFSDGKGIDRQGAAQTMSMEAFKEWLKTGETKSPMAAGAPDAQGTQSESNAEEGVAYFSIDGGLLQTSDLTFIEAAKAEGLTEPSEIRARAIQIAKDAGFWEAGGEVISKGALNLDGFRVQYRTTEDAAEKVTDLQVAMAKQLRKMGLPQIEAFAPEEMLATTPTGDIVRLGGFFSNDVIAVALRQDQDPMFTLSHEILHVLRSSSSWGGRLYGLFTETEWRALERQALKAPNAVKEEKIERYGAMGREIVIEELIADMAADYMTGGRSVKGFAGRALRKISQFFEALGNALRGLGFTTADQVFERISSGEVSARAESTTASPEVRFSLGPVKKRQSPQHAAHEATRMGGEPFLPDRRVWEELSDASQGYWGRIQGAAGAMHDKIDAARIRIQDRFLPVLRAQEAVQMAAGKPLPPEQDVYVAETTFSGKVGRHLFEIDEDFTKPILDLIGQTKGALTVDTVGEWLTARHAIERNAAIARINPTMPDGGSGMATAKALNILQDAENGPHIETLMAIGERIDALRDRTLKLREDAGLITSEEATIWRNQYDSYVPLKGFAETDHSENYLDAAGTGRRFSISGKESRRALGRQSEAFNPLQAAITQAQEVAIRAEKNRVGQAMVELVTNNPAPKMWDVKKPKQQRVFNKTSGLVETRTDNPVGLFMNDNEMAVKVDGEEMRIIFNDRRLARAAGSVGADQMGWFIQIMSMAARYFSAVNTMMDPEFVIRNAFRDMTSAQFNIRNFGEGDRNRIAKDMAKNWPRAFAGAFRGQRNKSDTKWSQYFKEFEEAGAKVSFWVLDQPEAGKADMEKRIKLASGNLLQKASKFARFSTRDNPVLGFIERTNLAVDNAVRLAAFVSARDAGWEVQDAAALSKNLTVNFNRRGEWGATINALYPFANAGIQGTQILVRAMTAKRMIKYTVGMIALGAILDQVNASWSEEDEDGELAYDKIPDWKNQMNLVVMLGPDSGNAATIWMPYGYNIFPYMGQQASKVARGVKDPSDALGDIALAAFSAFSPLGGGNLQSILTPTMLDPVNEMVANEDWLGRPIRPESPYADYAPAAYKFYRGASTTARVTADTLNRATGGTIAESGMIDVSPEYIDHTAGFAFGGVGRFAGRTVDLAGNLLTGQIAEIEDKDIPFYRSLQTTTGDWLDQSRYYSFRERVREGAEAAETYRDNNLPVPDHIARLAKLEDGLKAVEKELRKTRKQKRAIDADEDLSLGEKATKRQEIREKDLKEMMPFNKKFVEVMGPQGE